jgi:hypothetical protein
VTFVSNVCTPARHQISLCSDDLLKPSAVSPVMHVTKKLLDNSGSRTLFLDAVRDSITNENTGVRQP